MLQTLFEPEQVSFINLRKPFPFWRNCPYQIRTALPTSTNPQFVDVTVFDFKKQLLSLIDDPSLFGDIGNLDVNKDNLFGKYRAKDKLLSTVNSGQRYKYASQTMIHDKESEVLMSIAFACDETKVFSQVLNRIGQIVLFIKELPGCV